MQRDVEHLGRVSASGGSHEGGNLTNEVGVLGGAALLVDGFDLRFQDSPVDAAQRYQGVEECREGLVPGLEPVPEGVVEVGDE